MVALDTWDTRNERLLRDRLRGHPDDPRAYGDLETALVEAQEPGEEDTRAKTVRIQQLVDRARAAT